MTRKLMIYLMLLMTVLLLCACGDAAPTGEAAPESTPEVTGEAGADTGGTTTLMVYMIGSDLEAKTAAGTADLTEMAESGVDLAKTNVLVYAGGTPYWHNEVASTEQNTILSLTETGFQAVHSETAVSMGEVDTLTGFLNYSYENYPADRFALILWNHGSGPLRGYGQDLVFDDGSLLLSEMEQAMAASPFGPDNKLLFVGFDACLMASAELACIWDDYAGYMVSSQEVEPSIGWNYQFLQTIGDPDTPAMLTGLTETYLGSCEAYYTEKNFDHRETTLSCVDLSKAADLESAINGLFTKAADDVNQNFDRLSALRVGTRSFGRASTGSEYDLVDLGDAAKQLQDLYPAEAAQLLSVLEEMVIANATNTELCSGLSLYYPFYNKDYFYRSIRGEDSWQTTYQNMGLFPGYQQYLDAYQEIWNGTDRLDQFASSIMPSIQNGAYTLQLTEEQQACYASCRYYILARESLDLYKLIFVSSDVTNNNGLLTANFDGNAIYVSSPYVDKFLPAVKENDRVGDMSHYSVYAGLSNDMSAVFEEGAQYKLETYRYHLELDKSADTLSLSALLPMDMEPEDLSGGKLEEPDLSEFVDVTFFDQSHYYPTRDEKGMVLPIAQWEKNDWITGRELSLADGVSFSYEPLAGGEYFLLMEVQDTQGNRYCSEMLPITVPEQEETVITYPEENVSWDSGDRVLLKEENNTRLYLTQLWDRGNLRFTLELENNNDFPVSLSAESLVCNNSIYCKDSFGSIDAQPGQTAWFDYLEPLGIAETSGDLESLQSLSFYVHIRNKTTGGTLCQPRFYNVTLSSQVSGQFRDGYEGAPFAPQAILCARAEKQVIYQDDSLRLTLLGMGAGGSYSDSLYGILLAENRTDSYLTTDINGVVINGLFVSCGSSPVQIAPGLTAYIKLELGSYKLEELSFTGIERLSLLVRTVQDHYVFTGFSTPIWCDIVLSEKAEAVEPFREAQQVIYEQNGIRIAVDAPTDVYGTTCWYATVYNGNTEGIQVCILDMQVNGAASENGYLADGQAGPGQYGYGTFKCYVPLQDVETFTFRIQIRDIYEQQILSEEDVTVTLTPNGKEAS